jgi:hypothetical protein
MRRLLEGVDGVDRAHVQIDRNAQDLLKNAVVVPYDPKRVTRHDLARHVGAHWELSWYECPCGQTSPAPKDC